MPPPTADPEPALILVVNDDDAERYATTRRLQRASYRVLEARSGHEALQQLEQQPDLVLLDVRLPDIHGFEVCRLMRAHDPSRWLPIIHISAVEFGQDDVVAGLEGGADSYLHQPVPFPVLLATLRALLRGAREQVARALAEATTASVIAASRQAEAEHRAELELEQDLRRQLQARARQQAAVVELGQLALGGGRAEALIEIACRRTAELLGLECCRVTEPSALGTTAGDLLRNDELFPPNEPVFVTEWPADGEEAAPSAARGTRIVVRIGSHEAPLGLLEGFSLARRRVEEEEAQFLQSVAHVVARVLQRDRDERARQLLHEQMLQSQKMEAVGKLAGGVAHDFNNMLAVINGYANLLLEESHGEPTQDLRLREILRAGERAARLTRQLLAFSRRQVFTPELLDPNELVTNLGGLITRLIGEDIELQIEADPKAGRILGDPGQIEQCLINLAVNAREAMPDGGRLTIRISRTARVSQPDCAPPPGQDPPSSGYVTLTVRDNGQGIPPDVRARIFEPFFTTKGAHGTGMGLSIVYGIVTQSGGCIETESRPGEGAEFRLHFPRAIEEAGAEDPPEVLPETLGQETILLVEDEEMLRQLGRTILEMEGFAVLTAANGAEAIEISRERSESISLLITDVVMPGGMSGRDVADLLGKARAGLKVLYMSGYLEDAVMRHGVAADGIAFLQKPFSPTVLVKKVRELLEA